MWDFIFSVVTVTILKVCTAIICFSATPIIPEDEVLFNPTKDEILAGQNLFTPGRNHKIEFLKSAVYTEQLPQYDMPEV